MAIGYGASMPSRLELPVIPGVDTTTGLPPCPGLRGEPCRDYVASQNQPAPLTLPGPGDPGSGNPGSGNAGAKGQCKKRRHKKKHKRAAQSAKKHKKRGCGKKKHHKKNP